MALMAMALASKAKWRQRKWRWRKSENNSGIRSISVSKEISAKAMASGHRNGENSGVKSIENINGGINIESNPASKMKGENRRESQWRGESGERHDGNGGRQKRKPVKLNGMKISASAAKKYLRRKSAYVKTISA
jgi:hypothetical protein